MKVEDGYITDDIESAEVSNNCKINIVQAKGEDNMDTKILKHVKIE